jgi:two-component system cell cycle response regulator
VSGADESDQTLRIQSKVGVRGVPGSAPVPAEACLVVIYGDELGKRFPLRVPAMIGRDAENDIVLDSAGVSRQHAAIVPAPGAWAITDLGSTNGTHVNDAPIIGTQPLESGDHVKVGGTIFKYIAGGELEALFYAEIYRLTIYDGLTRVHNRRYFEDFLDREASRSERHERPLALALVDVDHFKKLNDQYGHVTGDQVLREVAARVSRLVRAEQLLARYGGEEFALVLPEVPPDRALVFCQRLCRVVAQEEFKVGSGGVTVTVSVGLSAFVTGMTRDELVKRADEALYEAKRTGRNRVVAHAG